MASLVASWSKDPGTKVGAVIVRPDLTVASLGYNGFPRGVVDFPKYLNNKEEKYARTVHAELNAILNSKEPLSGYTLYWYPGVLGTCSQCAAAIIQSGIKRVVTSVSKGDDTKSVYGKKGFTATVGRHLLKQRGIIYEEI